MRKQEFCRELSTLIPKPLTAEGNPQTELLRRLFWDRMDDLVFRDGSIAPDDMSVFYPVTEVIDPIISDIKAAGGSQQDIQKLKTFRNQCLTSIAFVLQPNPVQVESHHAEPLDHHSHAPTAIHTDAMPQGARGAINSETA